MVNHIGPAPAGYANFFTRHRASRLAAVLVLLEETNQPDHPFPALWSHRCCWRKKPACSRMPCHVAVQVLLEKETSLLTYALPCGRAGAAGGHQPISRMPCHVAVQVLLEERKQPAHVCPATWLCRCCWRKETSRSHVSRAMWPCRCFWRKETSLSHVCPAMWPCRCCWRTPARRRAISKPLTKAWRGPPVENRSAWAWAGRCP